MKQILVLDIGGTHIKALVLPVPDGESPAEVAATRDAAPQPAATPVATHHVTGTPVLMVADDPSTSGPSVPALHLDSGPTLTAAQMVAAVRAATPEWHYDAISIGYPGPVVDGRPAVEPHNLGAGWVGFDFAAAFGCPVRVINDAAMQALGGYRGGRMLFLGLGTGLGSALVVEGHVQPLELAHLPYRKRTFEEYVGEAGRETLGGRRWRRAVIDVVTQLYAAMQVDSVLIGGGNARRIGRILGKLPSGTRLGSNADALRGGVRLWASADVRADVQVPAPVADASAREPIPAPPPIAAPGH